MLTQSVKHFLYFSISFQFLSYVFILLIPHGIFANTKHSDNQWGNARTAPDYRGHLNTYRNIEITSLRALLISPDLSSHFGRISYRITMQRGMAGVRFEFQKLEFNPPISFDGVCFPSFFMIMHESIATTTHCGNFSGNQQDIFAKEGSVVELLIVNQLPYLNEESPSWSILVSQINEGAIEPHPLMHEEKDVCGIKKDSPPDENSRTVLPPPSKNAPWIEDGFNNNECRYGKGCRLLRNKMEENAFNKSSNKIINGREANTWPWMAALGTFRNEKFKIFCGAAIVGRQLIATAAHCVQFSYHDMKLEDIVVAIRAHDLGKIVESGREYFSISKVIINPEFYGVRNDMALLQLNRPLNYDDKCSSICLPWNTENKLEGSPVVITGWGLTSTYGSPSPTLQEAAVRCIPNANCSANWIALAGKEVQGVIEPSMVCCGGESLTCNGDSGSPVHFQGDNGKWILAGLVSFGPEFNCQENRYGVLSVHTRTTYFMKWIALCLAKPPATEIVTYY